MSIEIRYKRGKYKGRTMNVTMTQAAMEINKGIADYAKGKSKNGNHVQQKPGNTDFVTGFPIEPEK